MYGYDSPLSFDQLTSAIDLLPSFQWIPIKILRLLTSNKESHGLFPVFVWMPTKTWENRQYLLTRNQGSHESRNLNKKIKNLQFENI